MGEEKIFLFLQLQALQKYSTVTASEETEWLYIQYSQTYQILNPIMLFKM